MNRITSAGLGVIILEQAFPIKNTIYDILFQQNLQKIIHHYSAFSFFGKAFLSTSL
jgi:hypothetical protein